jgi:hypothetical protein
MIAASSFLLPLSAEDVLQLGVTHLLLCVTSRALPCQWAPRPSRWQHRGAHVGPRHICTPQDVAGIGNGSRVDSPAERTQVFA